jgi:3'-5' exoribonuclease
MDDERIFVGKLRPGMTVDDVFLVREKDLRTTRGGDLYITCTLVDRTGDIAARMWQASQNIFDSIPVEGFLHVKGRTDEYKGNLQLIIDACRPVSQDKVDLGDYLAVTERDTEEMWSELLEILRGIKDHPLRRLIKKFVEDRELVAALKRAPAAMQMHHPFIGGWLEHTLNVARAAKALLPLYPEINADLVLAGVFLHDIGKAAELSGGTTISYTDRGQLVGHITIAVIWTHQKARELSEENGEDFPERTLTLLQHIILSHHGEHEYGSPKLPAIPEAYFIHYLDNLDAKVFMTTRQIADDPDAEATFTRFNRALGTVLYKRSGDLTPDEDDQPMLF